MYKSIKYYINASDIDIISGESCESGESRDATYTLFRKMAAVKVQALLLPNLQHSI
jgi:hypothetical protein